MIETADALGEWVRFLVANSFLAVIVFGVVALLAKIAPRRGPAIRAALWSLVLIRLVLPPGLGHPFASGALVERLVHRDAAPQASLAVGGSEGFFVPWEQSGTMSPATRTAGGWLLPATGMLWLVGFLVMAAIQVRRLRAVRRVLAGAAPCCDPALLGVCETWRRRLHVRRRVGVVASDTALAPFTVGVFRPVVYVPRAVVEKRKCMEAAVAHEMAHVARFDALWLRLQQVVQGVYFFNPVVWSAGARLNGAREQLCDETVVAADRLAAGDYARGLLDVLRLELQGVGAPAMTSTRKRRIGVRIRNIYEHEGGQPKVGVAVVVAAVVGCVLLPLGSSGADSSAAPAVPAAEERASAPSPDEAARLSNPLPVGRVTWSWGPGHLDPFTHKKVSHTGIDLAAPTGTRVFAPADGVVRVATESYDPSPASGTVILIDHDNGLSTFFAHLHSLEVSPGQRVERGAVIGTVGSTGKSTGPHLHFETRRDGEAVDPAEYVEEWRE